MSKKKGASLSDSIPTGAEIKKDPLDDYEVKDHLDTLIRAHKLMADPEKMKKVHALAGRHSKAITSIQGIKDAYHQKFGSGAKKRAMVVDDTDDDKE